MNPVTLVVSTEDLTDFESWTVQYPHITVHRSPLCPDGHAFIVDEEQIQYRMMEVLRIYDQPR